MTAAAAVLDHFRDTAPRRAFCTDYPRDGQYLRVRAVALQHRHIQPNPTKLIRWLCFDIDRPDAAYRWQDVNACPPSLVMVNPANGHAHYAYALKAPVPRTEISRIKPLQYLAAIEEGTRRRIGADPGFSGGLIKTPGHSAWRTLSFGGVYELSDLAEWCDLPSPLEMRRMAANEDYAGLGRNCTLFEHVRKQAYQDVRQFWRPGGFEPFRDHCLVMAESMNRFANPLPQSELRSLARSVSKWVWQRFNPAEFRTIQASRGRRKGAARRAELMPTVLEMAARGFTQQAIADSLNIPQQTVSNWLKAARQ